MSTTKAPEEGRRMRSVWQNESQKHATVLGDRLPRSGRGRGVRTTRRRLVCGWAARNSR